MAEARALFAERGYAAVGTEEIVKAAGVTRGALYHHFEDKEALFRAVFEQVETEITERIAQGALADPDPIKALLGGTEQFLDVCREPEVQQIALLDAPAVLGYELWREIEADYALGLIRAGLTAAMEAGALAQQPTEPLAHVLLGALTEGALYLARAEDADAARAEVGETFTRLIDGLRA